MLVIASGTVELHDREFESTEYLLFQICDLVVIGWRSVLTPPKLDRYGFTLLILYFVLMWTLLPHTIATVYRRQKP